MAEVPKKKLKSESRIPRDRKILMRNRSNVQKKIRKSTCKPIFDQLMTKLLEIEDKIKKSHVYERDRNEDEVIGRIKDNPKFFYKYARENSIVKSPIGPLIKDNGTLVNKSEDICEILKSQF